MIQDLKNVIIVSLLIFIFTFVGSLGHSKLVLAKQLTLNKQQKYEEKKILAEQLMRELFLRKNEVQIRVEKQTEQTNIEIAPKPIVVPAQKILAEKPETFVLPVAEPAPEVVIGPDNTQIEAVALAKQMANLKQKQQKSVTIAHTSTQKSNTKSSRQSAAS
ncbi:hypothetical protein COZ82_01410 [Candidatus Kaiserbacteria bacterium CG_4_8_14_3_um_filter_38_9]|uniref:Uncharacterized protein n=1 Tax=Candidatus Kaiserbacteria bacterium CG_4_8_14_3_um_filter_38_9 TaxID=1974599 RepID=A0A2M7IPA6_9BACT|nr:MAG: hypothetical protein COZ82_01410 [Candidatus Kaiserbacteria bacterium CG_4_8_14_3_um_filter_38_9]